MRKKNSISFYEWCKENNGQDLLDRWDYNLNVLSPNDVPCASNKGFYFLCNKNLNHKSKKVILGNIVFNNNKVKCIECNSLENWCKENDRLDILKLWDYELNNKNPNEVLAGSVNKCWIKCPNGIHKSELKRAIDICNIYLYKCNACNSIGQWLLDNHGEDALEKYWDYNKNKEDPFTITIGLRIKVWIYCQNKSYHNSYKINVRDIVRGHGCSYCSHKSGKVHVFDSIGYLSPNILSVWSDRNNTSPYSYSKDSTKLIWFKCENNIHDEYQREIYSSRKKLFHCPNCVRERKESFLQEKVRLYLTQNLLLNINHEYECTITPKNPKTNLLLPFDNEIINLKLIIEVHGKQHYELLNKDTSWLNGQTPEEYLKQRKLYDRYKKAVAECNGYFYLEIPYWTEKDKSYKTLIDEKISEIEHKLQTAS